jgi:hypothetical protein
VAAWTFFSAILYFIGIIAIAVFALPDALGYKWGPADGGAIFGLSVGMLVLLCFAALCFASGIGILMAKSWGRMLTFVVAILGLFWFPVGTVIGILIIIYLARPEIKEYFEGGS